MEWLHCIRQNRLLKQNKKKNFARDKEGFCTNRRINPLGEPNNYKPHIPTNKPPNM